MKMKIVGFDPSLTSFGIAVCNVDVETLAVDVADLILIATESESKKGVIKTSDDHRRAREVYLGMVSACDGAALAVSEMPFLKPNDYPRATFNAGMVTGVLAACPIPLIQVFPQDVKLAAVGHRQAAKEEMITWGIEKHPDAPWLFRNFKGTRRPTAANEHLADAVASVYAGLQTQQFAQARAMYRSMREAA